MMNTYPNFKTKEALIEAVKVEKNIRVFDNCGCGRIVVNNHGITVAESSKHPSWYAKVVVKNRKVIKVL